MKKIVVLFALVFIAAAVTVTAVSVSDQKNQLLLANLEALAGNENSSLCPDHNYAPNGVIRADTYTTYVTADFNGNISVYGKVEGGYKKNKNYSVTYEVKNCNEWPGACCDQREVGVKIVSAS